jgi:hypothetical protein
MAIDNQDGMATCAWTGCGKRFKPNLAKKQECCSPKCRGARWRARASQTAAITEIKAQLSNHAARLTALENK